MKQSIGIDLDGVLYPWHEAVHDYHKHFKNCLSSFSTFWSEDFKEFTPEYWKFMTEIDTLYSCEPPMEGALDFLRSAEKDYDIYYITSRPKIVSLTTEQYLRRYKFPFQDNLIFSEDKVNTCRILQLKWFVEDKPANLKLLSGVTDVIMYYRPYNKHFSDVYKTAKSFKDVANFMEIKWI